MDDVGEVGSVPFRRSRRFLRLLIDLAWVSRLSAMCFTTPTLTIQRAALEAGCGVVRAEKAMTHTQQTSTTACTCHPCDRSGRPA